MSNRVIATLVCIGLLAAACLGVGSGETASTVGTTASSTVETPASTEVASTQPATSGVTVAEDLVYLAAEPNPWKLDVYFSPASEGGPVVVFFHGGGLGRTDYRSIAEPIAAGGGVVFVPDWDTTTASAGTIAAAVDSAWCAVSYASAHASDYGADPERLVAAAHSAGAWAAAGGLRRVSPVTDCAVATDATNVDGMVLWDGDWLMGGPMWDRFGNDIPGIMDAVLPWAHLEDAPLVPVVLVTSSRAPDELKRCDVVDPEASFWERDPDGWFRDQLDQLGMLDDGCLDNGEGEELLANTMLAHGFDATRLILADSGHLSISDRGRAQLTEAILTITDR